MDTTLIILTAIHIALTLCGLIQVGLWLFRRR